MIRKYMKNKSKVDIYRKNAIKDWNIFFNCNFPNILLINDSIF